MNILKYIEIEKSKYANPIYLNQWSMESGITNINYDDFITRMYEYRMRILFSVSFSSDDKNKDSFISNLSESLNHALYGDLVTKLIDIKVNASRKNWVEVDDMLNNLIDEYTKI